MVNESSNIDGTEFIILPMATNNYVPQINKAFVLYDKIKFYFMSCIFQYNSK